MSAITATTGTDDACAPARPETRFVTPGPTVASQNPPCPERRPYASAAPPPRRGLCRARLHAAFPPEERRAIADEAGLGDAEVVIDSDRHMSLQVPAQA